MKEIREQASAARKRSIQLSYPAPQGAGVRFELTTSRLAGEVTALFTADLSVFKEQMGADALTGSSSPPGAEEFFLSPPTFIIP